MPHDTNYLDNCHPSFNNYSISAVNNDQTILVGRPYGGLSVLYRKDLTLVGNVVNMDDNRLTGFCVTCNNFKYLFVNLYLPYYAEENMAEYTMYLGKLEGIIEEYDVDGMVVMGDFNAEPGKEYYDQLKLFCEEHNLIISDVEMLPQDSYTHLNNASLRRSWLDHCVTSPGLHNAITSISIDNNIFISDHFPLFVNIDFNGLPKGILNNGVESDKIKWDFSDQQTSAMFYERLKLDYDFNFLSDFCFCTKNCNDVMHWACIEERWDSFIKSVNRIGYEVFGLCQSNKNVKCIPGWNAQVKAQYARSRAEFLHWKRLGSPRHGEDAQRMRSARAAFKYALRQCRRNEDAMRAEAMSRKLASGDSRSFWRCATGSGGAAVRPDRIDGAVGDADVADLWARKYGAVLNSVHDERVCHNFNRVFDTYEATEVDHVTVHEVSAAIEKLKEGKAVGLDNVPNEFYRNCPVYVKVFLSLMLNSFLIHEFVPETITEAKIMPLLKDKLLDFSSSENYRPITISTSISKVFEIILFARMKDKLVCKDNQFGYKTRTSTDVCIFTFKETVRYYLLQNTPVFVCFLDVKSAFDKLSHWKLYEKLVSQAIPKKIINIIKFWNSNQRLCVAWGDHLSYRFYMTNGIRQGSLVSPFLYNFYVDILSVMLNESGVGCCIGAETLNNLSWADDLVVMAPSAVALSEMLQLCDKFAEDHLMTFNTKKTKCMLFNCSKSPVSTFPIIKLSGKELDFVHDFKYLGHIISSDMSDNKDIMAQNKKLCARGNMIIRKMKPCSNEIKCLMFKTYCYGIYGAALWSTFTGVVMNRLRVNYNNILRRLMNVPPWSSASELFVSHHLRGFAEQRRACSYNLMQRVLQSPNTLVQRVVHSDARAHSPLWRQWETLLHRADG